MGYRSDGKLWFSEEAKELFTNEIAEALSEYDVETAGNYTIYSFDGWKWYNSYPEIQLMENFMSELDEKEIPYEFIRMGEDDGDIEHRGDWDLFYISRSIEIY